MIAQISTRKQVINLSLTGLNPYAYPGYVAVFSIGRKNISDRWLHVNGVPSNLIGFPVTRASYIRKIAFQAQNEITGTVYIRKKGSDEDLITLSITDESFSQRDDLYVPLLETDLLQAFIESSSGIDYPVVSTEMVWQT